MAENKKATAPVSSVGADGKQSLCKTNKQSIADLPDKGNLQATKNNGAGQSGQEKLQTVTMEELYDTVYPPKVPIVDGLIYNGTYLFVGAPKVGKSFFMAQLGYHVSRGIPLWDYPVNQGTVLYLALEDDYGRLQKRLSRMFGMESTSNFYFATRSKSLNEGLEEQLTQFVKEHKDASGIKPTERKPLPKPKSCTKRYKGIKKRLIGRMPVNLIEAEIKERDERPLPQKIALSTHIMDRAILKI